MAKGQEELAARQTPQPGEARPLALFAAMAAAFVALFAATSMLPHDPYIRYQQLRNTLQFRSQWIYERTQLDPTPIDVAVIGNSRMQAGISGPTLEADLSRAEGRPIHVANISMPQEGRDMQYVVAKRLLASHPEVKLILLSVIEQMPREGHPAFRDLADAGDVLGAPVLGNTAYFTNLAALPYRQMSLFAQTLFPGAFGDHVTRDPAYDGTSYDTTQSFRLPDGRLVDRDSTRPPEELAATAHHRVAGITPPLLPAALADTEFAVERRYARDIAALARAHGVDIAFLYLPIYDNRQPVRERAFYAAMGPILYPGFVSGDPNLYADYGHLNRTGVGVVEPWLVGQILALQRSGAIRQLSATPPISGQSGHRRDLP